MHHHLNRDSRAVIGAMRRQGYRQADIARTLNVHRATVCRELQRNADGTYHAAHANVLARVRRRASKAGTRKLENDTARAARIAANLTPLVSPEVVGHAEGIHHQTIYSWITRSRRDLLPQLPQRGRKRRRYGSKRANKQGWTRHVRPIAERTEHTVSWEGDTITGRTRARILTHVERQSLFLRADLIPDGTADSVHAVLKKTPLPGTITYDRGSEFALWRMIERDTPATVFFAQPHAPWQRGKNENTNGRLRRVFPKRTDFSMLSQRDLARIVHYMNHTPRKSLSWRTPAEVFKELCCVSS